MGKIVKRAAFLDGSYVVGVPHVETPAPVRAAVPFHDHPTIRVDIDPFAQTFDAEPETFEERVDWDAVKADAEAIVDRAAADAQALLDEAQRRAMEIVAQAETQTHALEAQARDRGYDEGVAAGKAATDAEMEAMILTMRQLIESARAERHEIVESAEPELVRLALAIAERIIHVQISMDPTVVVESARAALSRLVAREVVTLRVNPADLETLREHRDAIVTSTDVEHLRVVEDQRVDRGGVVIETESGTIDAKIATQLREARRAIAADEPIVALSVDDGVLHNPPQAS